MKKGSIRAVTALLVLLVLYLIVTFVAPFYHGPVFWCTFGFSLLAFALAGISAYLGFVKQPDAKSKFYGFPILRIGAIYLVAHLVLGLIFTLAGRWISIWIPVILYAVGAGIAALGLISADAVVGQIRRMDDKMKKNVTMMRSLQSKVNQLPAQCEDAEAADLLKAFCEEIRFSDPVSSEAIQDAEWDLSAVVDELQQAVVDGDADAIKVLCKRGRTALAERNRLCKLNK